MLVIKWRETLRNVQTLPLSCWCPR